MSRRKGKARSIADSTHARCERRIEHAIQAVREALGVIGVADNAAAKVYLKGMENALWAMRRKESGR